MAVFVFLSLAGCDEALESVGKLPDRQIIVGPELDRSTISSENEQGMVRVLSAFGELCEENSDCESSWCVPANASESLCSRLCGEGAECPSGWGCRAVNNTGVDITYICVPQDDRLCRPCGADTDCPSGRCVELDGLSVCASDCAEDADCPDGYSCGLEPGADESVSAQCLPVSGSCSCDADKVGEQRICERESPAGLCVGRQTCEGSRGWSACDAPEPSPERCNQIDDDCNGITDDLQGLGEACAAEATVEGELIRCEGRFVCGPESEELTCTAQTPEVERCNFFDDDCDGQTDEGFEERDQICNVGVGACQRFGVLSCSEDELELVCNVSEGSPTEERCDGLDNDCDGNVDEDFPQKGSLCEVGLGICQGFGTLQCAADGGSLACTAEEGTPAQELCDGLDNNCDGQIDELFPTLGEICTAGEGQCRRASIVRCAPDGLGIICEVEAGEAEPERCDGLDNDCDLSIDEAFPLLGRPCEAGLGECERRGLYICDGEDSVRCSAEAGEPAEEICDGRDNDCDGEIDNAEAFEALGDVCRVGDGACEAVGLLRCSEDGETLRCDATPGEPALAERCDGIDNDCDLRIDEGFEGLGETCREGLGVCFAAGLIRCTEDGSAARCDAQPLEPSDERCDALDNDCDGSVDEAFPTLGEICEAGEGVCRQASVTRCDADGLGASCEVRAGDEQPERCDGLDNDCDGETDEDFPTLGDGCTAGIGACARQGLLICPPAEGEPVCSVGPGRPTPERCDGLDNNCDGTVDEGFPEVGEICQVGVGACSAVGTFRCALDGLSAACSVEEGAPEDERCDSVDNDCDGEIDEGFEGVGEVCEVGQGICAASGLRVCDPESPEGVSCSAAVIDPEEERCDGLDNDCDGQTDEGFEGLGEICRLGQGLCAVAGVIECDASGERATCSVSPNPPQEERCDGLDNNCDGQVDEGFENLGAVCRVGRGVCEAAGVIRCSEDGIETECSVDAGAPEPELCDGLDNNCDGQVDEGFEGLGEVCRVGQGACEAAGVLRCSAVGDQVECSAQEGAPAAELCDGLDNNCDGEIDEGFQGIGEVCRVGQGICAAAGVIRCADDQLSAVCSVEAGAPEPERCDGLDNDCDGQVDEGFEGLGETCRDGIGACEASGVIRCSEDGTEALCSAVPGQPEVERCDGVDNNCDGAIDEAFESLGELCRVGVGTCESVGTLRCSEDGASTECSATEGAPEAERCDGLDNNCDGIIDEGFENLGAVCRVGAGICQAAGVIRCSEDGAETECSVEAGAPEVERCDGLDNNCDGQVDEDFEGLGEVCRVGQGICQNSGVVRCTAEGFGTECSVEPGVAEAERCDGLDNNCDGLIDEGFADLGEVCRVGQGICQNSGVVECAPD
ncbi:MAG: MopE-related protein, partial [Myxococcota bacterium]|nr:MopE-related protein [Myxococcota bacterium]